MDTHVIMYVVIRFVYDYYVMQLVLHCLFPLSPGLRTLTYVITVYVPREFHCLPSAM